MKPLLALAVLIGLAPLPSYAASDQEFLQAHKVPDAVLAEIKAACVTYYHLFDGFDRKTEENRQAFNKAVQMAEICALKSGEVYRQLHGQPIDGFRPWIVTDEPPREPE